MVFKERMDMVFRDMFLNDSGGRVMVGPGDLGSLFQSLCFCGPLESSKLPSSH